MRTGMRMLAVNAIRNNGERRDEMERKQNGQQYSRMEERRNGDQYGSYGREYETRTDMRYPRMEMNDDMESRRRRYEDGRFAPSNNYDYDMERYGENTIGFRMNYIPEIRREYRERAEYPHMRGMEYRSGDMKRGHTSGPMMEELDHKTAQKWVQDMKSGEGSGGIWNELQTENVMKQLGIRENPIEFYAIMNAMKSDYEKVAKSFGVDKPEFYARMAEAWLNDEDAVENKAAIYYECIVKH